VRAAEAADHDAMAEVFLAAGRAAWGFAGEEALAAMRAPAITSALVAEDEHGVAGFVVPADCVIALLYTHPRVWGAGLGRELLAAGEAALRSSGCTEATLWTEERNERPRRFYEAAGWELDGGVRERVWNGVRLRELRYAKALRPAPRS
jgi:GNAT superfamily N-acetyltransferase